MRKKKTRSIKRSYTYGEFIHLLPFCAEEHQADLLSQLEKAQKPAEICGVPLPDNLNEVSYGLLDDLSNISQSKDGDPMVESIVLILNDAIQRENASNKDKEFPLDLVSADKVYSANVFDVFGMAKWVGAEVKKINALFDSISPRYSAEEIAAGVKSLNFGSFGVLDWYSHRQGISDQNLVRDVAWVRIYTCMKNDNIKAEYEKRLNKQYQNKYKNGKR